MGGQGRQGECSARPWYQCCSQAAEPICCSYTPAERSTAHQAHGVQCPSQQSASQLAHLAWSCCSLSSLLPCRAAPDGRGSCEVLALGLFKADITGGVPLPRCGLGQLSAAAPRAEPDAGLQQQQNMVSMMCMRSVAHPSDMQDCTQDLAHGRGPCRQWHLTRLSHHQMFSSRLTWVCRATHRTGWMCAPGLLHCRAPCLQGSGTCCQERAPMTRCPCCPCCQQQRLLKHAVLHRCCAWAAGQAGALHCCPWRCCLSGVPAPALQAGRQGASVLKDYSMAAAPRMKAQVVGCRQRWYNSDWYGCCSR